MKMAVLFRSRLNVIRAAAVALAIATTFAAAVTVLKYRAWSTTNRLAYTVAIKRIDIRDTARRAFYALVEAAFHQESYVLTGEISYSEAYANDIRTWNDESATLELVSPNDNARPSIRTLSERGKRSAGEMETIRSIYEKSGKEPALDRLRKGGPGVFIDQAREGFAEIDQLYGTATYLAGDEVILQRLLGAALLLSAMALAQGILLILALRSAGAGRRSVMSTGERKSAAAPAFFREREEICTD